MDSTSLDTMDEVFVYLKSIDMEVAHMIIDGDRIELHGLRSKSAHEVSLQFPKNARGHANPEPPRDHRFSHTGITPHLRKKAESSG